jgi:hypothetical protein
MKTALSYAVLFTLILMASSAIGYQQDLNKKYFHNETVTAHPVAKQEARLSANPLNGALASTAALDAVYKHQH